MPRPVPDRLHALVVMVVLAIVCVAIASAGVRPARVSAAELLGSAREPGQAAFIAAHRGGASQGPENTLPAVADAIAAGFDYVEVDIRLTADGVPVLMHDRTVDRTTNGHGAVSSLTSATIRRLDAGVGFGPDHAGTAVPTLDEFLDLLASSRARALVELKGEWEAEDVADVVSALESRGLDRRVALSSFDVRTLGHVEAASPVVSSLLILRTLPSDVVTAAKQLDVRGIVADHAAIEERPEVIDQLRSAGIRVVVYTLNDDREWGEAIALGVDGIITDDPASLAVWQSALATR